MASTYTPLGIELMATGENAGTWGTKTNTNLSLFEQITGGFSQVSIAGGAQTTALTVVDGSTTGTAQYRMIEFTGTITGNQIVTIPLDVETFYFLRNSTTGAFTVQFKYATGSGTTFTFSATNKGDKLIFATANDGTNPDIAAIDTGIASVVDDTTPQLGGNLDLNSNDITGTGNINITGNITASANLAGTLTTASQPNITAVGNLTSLNVNGTLIPYKAYITEATLTDGATIDWDMSTEAVAKVTLAGNRTINAPTNGSTGQFASILVIQDATGSRTLTWNAVYEFASDTAPTLTTTANLGDLFVFRYNGSKWLEAGRNLALTLS